MTTARQVTNEAGAIVFASEYGVGSLKVDQSAMERELSIHETKCDKPVTSGSLRAFANAEVFTYIESGKTGNMLRRRIDSKFQQLALRMLADGSDPCAKAIATKATESARIVQLRCGRRCWKMTGGKIYVRAKR